VTQLDMSCIVKANFDEVSLRVPGSNEVMPSFCMLSSVQYDCSSVLEAFASRFAARHLFSLASTAATLTNADMDEAGGVLLSAVPRDDRGSEQLGRKRL
jgi:hypothetical protein